MHRGEGSVKVEQKDLKMLTLKCAVMWPQAKEADSQQQLEEERDIFFPRRLWLECSPADILILVQ